MNTFTGCLPDTRTKKEKSKDYHKQLTVSGALVWSEKDFDDVKHFPVRNQDGSGSCVAQTLALILGIENYFEEGKFIEFSASDIYTKRTNVGMGMIGVEALEIARKQGVTLEVLMPSQNMGETEINQVTRCISDIEIGKIFKIKDHYQLPFDIDRIATMIASKSRDGYYKPLMVWFEFPRKEWDSKPKVTSSKNDIVRHSVAAIDFGIMDGKNGIFIQDSWGLDKTTNGGLRFISEDYINERMIFCAYVNDQENGYTEPKIKRVLKYGSRGDDVRLLQQMLGINADGILGRQTERAVKNFQKENGLVADGIVGQKTIAKLLA